MQQERYMECCIVEISSFYSLNGPSCSSTIPARPQTQDCINSSDVKPTQCPSGFPQGKEM